MDDHDRKAACAEKKRKRAACPAPIKVALQAAIDDAFESGRYANESQEARAFRVRRKKTIQRAPYAERNKVLCLVGELQLAYEALLKESATIE